jgi:hypothetical protein
MNTKKAKLTKHEQQLLDFINRKANFVILANRFRMNRWDLLCEIVDLATRGLVPASRIDNPADAIGAAVGYGADPETARLAKDLFNQAKEAGLADDPEELANLRAAKDLDARVSANIATK